MKAASLKPGQGHICEIDTTCAMCEDLQKQCVRAMLTHTVFGSTQILWNHAPCPLGT